MAAVYDAVWPLTFAQWMRSVMDGILGGEPNAFSIVVDTETRCKLDGELDLTVL